MRSPFICTVLLAGLLVCHPVLATSIEISFQPDTGFLQARASLDLITEEEFQIQLFPQADIYSFWVSNLQQANIERTKDHTSIQVNVVPMPGPHQTVQIHYQGFLDIRDQPPTLDQTVGWFPQVIGGRMLPGALLITVPQGTTITGVDPLHWDEQRGAFMYHWQGHAEPTLHFHPETDSVSTVKEQAAAVLASLATTFATNDRDKASNLVSPYAVARERLISYISNAPFDRQVFQFQMIDLRSAGDGYRLTALLSVDEEQLYTTVLDLVRVTPGNLLVQDLAMQPVRKFEDEAAKANLQLWLKELAELVREGQWSAIRERIDATPLQADGMISFFQSLQDSFQPVLYSLQNNKTEATLIVRHAQHRYFVLYSLIPQEYSWKLANISILSSNERGHR